MSYEFVNCTNEISYDVDATSCCEDLIKSLAHQFLGDVPIKFVYGVYSKLYIYEPNLNRYYDATVEGLCQLKEDCDELYDMVDIGIDFNNCLSEKEKMRLAIRRASGRYPWDRVTRPALPDIKKVIFNDPATIVFWTDGTKTVVQAHDEKFDKEKGIAMAIAKKTLGNKGNYFEIFKKYCGEE